MHVQNKNLAIGNLHIMLLSIVIVIHYIILCVDGPKRQSVHTVVLSVASYVYHWHSLLLVHKEVSHHT